MIGTAGVFLRGDKMTTEFRIDRPGVYRTRNGEHVCLWPTFSTGVWRWMRVAGSHISSYRNDGHYWFADKTSPYDIVAYIGPLPADILQRMRQMLALAEEHPQPTTPATFREAMQEVQQ
jgi:hypothetical protein